MEFQNVLVITWMIVFGLMSSLLIWFIIQYIYNKPLINKTLVDLIYCDLLGWIWIGNSVYASGIIVSHLSPPG